MINSGDYVVVNGSFITYTNKSHKDLLTAGILEIKGDFYQYGGGSKLAFPASGTHLAILSGAEKQNVTFESYPDSHFNLLKMEQDEQQYEFNENPCWNEIFEGTTTTKVTTAASTTTTTSSSTTTTASTNDPGQTTTTTPPSTEHKSGDANGDGEIDLKDVVMIRKYYAGWDVEINEENADANGDGTVDLKDVVILRRFVAGGWNVELA